MLSEIHSNYQVKKKWINVCFTSKNGTVLYFETGKSNLPESCLAKILLDGPEERKNFRSNSRDGPSGKLATSETKPLEIWKYDLPSTAVTPSAEAGRSKIKNKPTIQLVSAIPKRIRLLIVGKSQEYYKKQNNNPIGTWIKKYSAWFFPFVPFQQNSIPVTSIPQRCLTGHSP